MAALDAPVVRSDRVEPTDAADERLVERVRSGDERSFRLLYDRYFRRVYNFLDRRLPNRADTEETTQEVFINLFSSIHSYRGDAPFAAWVFGITRRTLASRFKRKHHPTVPLPDADGDGDFASRDASGDPLAAYECRERLDRLQRAMHRDLSEEQQQLVDLHHLQSRTIQEIALVLGKTEDAIKSNLYRARKLLLAR